MKRYSCKFFIFNISRYFMFFANRLTYFFKKKNIITNKININNFLLYSPEITTNLILKR